MGERGGGGRSEGIDTSSDVTNASWVSIPVIDQERNDPAGDGDFGALVREDEQGAEDGRPVPDGLFEQLHSRRLTRFSGRPTRCGAFKRQEELSRAVLLVGPEGPPGEDEVHGRDAQRQEVEARPDDAVRGHGGGDQRADGAADAVAAVEGAQRGRAVDEVGAEDVVEGEIDGHAEAGEEEAVRNPISSSSRYGAEDGRGEKPTLLRPPERVVCTQS